MRGDYLVFGIFNDEFNVKIDYDKLDWYSYSIDDIKLVKVNEPANDTITDFCKYVKKTKPGLDYILPERDTIHFEYDSDQYSEKNMKQIKNWIKTKNPPLIYIKPRFFS